MSEDYDLMLGEIFSLLKKRNKENLGDLYRVLNLYEDFREAASISSSEFYERFAIVTGKAISNICFDLMRHPSAVTLSNASADIIREGHIFFLGHRGGLCNRLRAIAALEAAADSIGSEFAFSWVETDACRGGPLPWRNFGSRVSPRIHRVLREEKKVVFEDNPVSAWQFFDKFKKIGLLKSWPDFKDVYIKKSERLLDSVIKKLNLYYVLENFFKENRLKDYTAVHIRRTDFVPYFVAKYPEERLPEISEYVDYVRSNCGGKKVFLSTDDVDVRLNFVNSLGDQVCFFDFDFDKSQLRQTSFQHAVLDLAVLSRSSELLTTPRSSFSDYAVSISNAEIIKLWDRV